MTEDTCHSNRGAPSAERARKLSAIDLPSRERWYEYSRARDMMLDATDTDFSSWYMVRSDDKKRARLNLISHFLSLISYEAPSPTKIKLPNRDKRTPTTTRRR